MIEIMIIVVIGLLPIFGIIIGCKPPYEYKETISTDYFWVKYNPKKDITAYEVAKLSTIISSHILTGLKVKVRRDVESDMELWNKTLGLMQRHFDIVGDSRD